MNNENVTPDKVPSQNNTALGTERGWIIVRAFSVVFCMVVLLVITACNASTESQMQKPIDKSGRLTPDEAKALIAEGGELAADEAAAVACELTTDEIWNRLGMQVFKLGMQGYLVGGDRITRLGKSFGGMGFQSVCVSDLDNNGHHELLFTHSWGSGIHRSEVEAWLSDWPDSGTFAAQISYTALPDMTLLQSDDQNVAIMIGDAHIGLLELDQRDDVPRLRVVLDPDVPAALRENMWESTE